MDTRPGIADILADAINAPSGDNSQPWYFRIKEKSLYIYNVPTADTTLYNFNQRGSYFAHGALIENIEIAAKEFGFKTDIQFFPGEENCTARIDFEPGSPEKDPLYTALKLRGTNRKPYEARPLEKSHREALSAAIGTFVKVTFIESTEGKAALAHAISMNEEVLMENKYMHDTLFHMIRWSPAHERRRPGLYIKTMEFPLPVQIAFRLFIRFWPIVRTLNVVGFSKSVPKQSMPVYRASSAIAALIISGTNAEDYVRAGRAFERLWLTATNLGIALQPTTAIPYLMQRIEEGDSSMIAREHTEKISDSYEIIAKEFSLRESERIAMLFRVGYDGEPSARSSKKPPIIVQ